MNSTYIQLPTHYDYNILYHNVRDNDHLHHEHYVTKINNSWSTIIDTESPFDFQLLTLLWSEYLIATEVQVFFHSYLTKYNWNCSYMKLKHTCIQKPLSPLAA